ncbi:MAG TPA: carboxypeptidase-like regulatory domain-containing protein [Planctomycetota bacterium]|nr:carboxypeptidase-like regulatory domain-containing protein [Planctomycetota bacterium]
MRSAALVAVLALCLTACADSGEPAADAQRNAPRTASVLGTVVDVATRAPVAGASVTAPGGTRARTDAAGRFRIDGLPPGLSGELVAGGPEGGEGRLLLRPLRPGPLEVVVHLRSP